MKAILLIDKAESCTGCMLGIYNKKWFCLATNKDIDITDRYSIPEWCPLKPMPEKIKREAHSLIEYVSSSYQYTRGWNDCLEDITGETE